MISTIYIHNEIFTFLTNEIRVLCWFLACLKNSGMLWIPEKSLVATEHTISMFVMAASDIPQVHCRVISLWKASNIFCMSRSPIHHVQHVWGFLKAVDWLHTYYTTNAWDLGHHGQKHYSTIEQTCNIVWKILITEVLIFFLEVIHKQFCKNMTNKKQYECIPR